MTESTSTDINSALVHTATLAADIWAMNDGPSVRTKADYTRGIVETAVMHLIEQGLVVPTDDVEERMQQGVSLMRVRPDG